MLAPCLAAFVSAIESASSLMSVAVMVAFWSSCAMVMAIMPDPDPMSQMLGCCEVM